MKSQKTDIMCVTLNTFFSWAAIYFLVSMVLVGLSCLMTVLVLHIHYKNSAGVSPGFRNYVIKPLQRLTCFHAEDKHDKNVRLRILSLYIIALYQYSNLMVLDAKLFLLFCIPGSVSLRTFYVSKELCRTLK